MFIYLASPYSHASSYVRFERYIEAMKATRWLIAMGESAVSPIVHCHSMANIFEMPTDAFTWQQYNYGILSKADAIYVLAIEGWEHSKGITGEIEYAEHKHIERFRMEPKNEDYIISPF